MMLFYANEWSAFETGRRYFEPLCLCEEKNSPYLLDEGVEHALLVGEGASEEDGEDDGEGDDEGVGG